MEFSNKTIYLHIGTPKTGSTTIQHFLFQNKKVLEAKGVLYPTVKNNNNPVNLRPVIKDKKLEDSSSPADKKIYLKEAFEKNFLKQIKESNCNQILFSEEYLSGHLGPQGITEALIDILTDYGLNVKIIVYIRPAVELIVSLWQQSIKSIYHLEYLSFQEYLSNSSPLKFIALLPQLIDKVGAENVIIKPFEKEQFKNKDLISDFLDILGLELTKDFDLTQGDKNIGLGRNALELTRILNKIGLPTSPKKIRLIEEIAKDDIKLIESISDEEMLKIRDDYSDIYKKIASFCGKENSFINDLPKCFGKKRPLYKGLILTKEQLGLLKESLTENIKENYSFFEKVFSVKTQRDLYNDKYKVITILGFSLKIKKKG